MNAALIYVVGPSGVGKDSLLAWLRSNLPDHLPAHWAQRTIDRPRVPQGEAHESVAPEESGFGPFPLAISGQTSAGKRGEVNPFCINFFSTLVKPLSVVAVTFVGRELWVGMEGHSAASVFNMAQSFLGGKVVSVCTAGCG